MIMSIYYFKSNLRFMTIGEFFKQCFFIIEKIRSKKYK